MGQGGGVVFMAPGGRRSLLPPGFIATGTGDPSAHPPITKDCGCHTTPWRPHSHMPDSAERDFVLCPMHDRQGRERLVARDAEVVARLSELGIQ